MRDYIKATFKKRKLRIELDGKKYMVCFFSNVIKRDGKKYINVWIRENRVLKSTDLQKGKRYRIIFEKPDSNGYARPIVAKVTSSKPRVYRSRSNRT